MKGKRKKDYSLADLESIYRNDGECEELTCASRQIVWDSGLALVREVRKLRKENKEMRHDFELALKKDTKCAYANGRLHESLKRKKS